MSITEKNGLKISSKLFDFINKEVIPGTDIKTEEFWDSFAKTVGELAPINKNLLKKRETIQKKSMIGTIKIKEKILTKQNIKNFLNLSLI